MTDLKRKIWTLIRGGSFRGYLRTVSGYSLTLTDCMADKPVSLAVSGNAVQNGTPTPDNPVEVQGCGDCEEPYGYKVPLRFSGGNGAPVTFPIYLDAPLYGNGGVSDTVELDVEHRTAIVTHKYAELSFNGTESILTAAQKIDGYSRFYLKADTTMNTIAYSNKLSQRPHSEWGAVKAGDYFSVANDSIHFSVSGIGQTVTEIRQWLTELADAGTPLTVVYRLGTPTTTDISDKIDWDAIPKLWRGTAIVSADTAVEPSNIIAKYYADKPEGGE